MVTITRKPFQFRIELFKKQIAVHVAIDVIAIILIN